MDAKQTAAHPFQRLTLPHQPPPPATPHPLRHVEEPTPIFDQLLREWRAGALRPVVSWPVDDPAKGRPGAGVVGEDGR
ncbi:hypothetical protein [Streptomyces sp. NPDC101393]|uniref:hypothetical protein n=1 Tax=Streptomyces sp. NPDC101393 TaxID=3366141 RepID=UPI0037F742D9